MIIERDIIIFGDDLGRHPSTIQHIACQMFHNNRILWVGSISARPPKLQFSDLRRGFEKSISIFRKPNIASNQNNIYEFHPLVIPFFDLPLICRLNNWLLKVLLKKKIQSLNFKKPILITGTPMIADIVDQLGASSIHYLCSDDYAEFDDFFKIFNKMEKILLEKCNTCFAISKQLLTTRIPPNGKSMLLSQGVDYAHFEKRNELLPASIISLKKPIVGYFGLITSWVDIQLIEKSAKNYPEVSFVIIGRCLVDVTTISQLSNVFLLGEITYKELPMYASAFDVGLIPFVVNKLTLACNPIKLLEYFALGLPVVSTALPEVVKYGDLVYASNDHGEYIRFIGEALREKDLKKTVQRKNIARDNSWLSIAEKVSAMIEDAE
jgi:glycosyltransferase involved in cell wall biosynthesis